MTIGILTHNYPINSKERKDAGIFVYDFANELAKHAEVSVFCPDFGGKKEIYKNVPVTWFDWGGSKTKFGNWPVFSPFSIFNFFKLLFIGSAKAEEFVKKNKIDLCLAAWVIPSAIFALWVKVRLGVSYFVWILGSDVNKYAKLPILRQLATVSLRKADRRFANSYWLIDIIEKISGEKCDYMDAITNFNVEEVKPRELNKNIFNFLFVARLEKVKGPDVLINACIELKKVRSDFRLHILGDGSMRNMLEKIIEKNGLEHNIYFYGNASKDDVASFMKAADCLIVASRTESIPLVMVESARVGLAVISTDVGDCRRVISKYNIGYVVKNEDPIDMSEAMHRVVEEGKSFKEKRYKGLMQLSKDRSQKVAVGTFLSKVNEK